MKSCEPTDIVVGQYFLVYRRLPDWWGLCIFEPTDSDEDSIIGDSIWKYVFYGYPTRNIIMDDFEDKRWNFSSNELNAVRTKIFQLSEDEVLKHIVMERI